MRARIVAGLEHEGIAFRRLDRDDAPVVRATLDDVEASGSAYATTLTDRAGRPFVRTIEHVMSALVGAAVCRGVMVELEGDELPCLDGAAAVWFDAIDDAGLVGSAPARWAPRASFHSELDDGRSLSVSVATDVRISVEIEFDPPIGRQRASWDGSPRTYRDEIAQARTFATVAEAEAMLARDLARGVDPTAALVFGPDGPLVPPRWEDEPARHKLLDLIGDLALAGGLPQAHVHARRPGHAFVVRALRDHGPQIVGWLLTQ